MRRTNDPYAPGPLRLTGDAANVRLDADPAALIGEAARLEADGDLAGAYEQLLLAKQVLARTPGAAADAACRHVDRLLIGVYHRQLRR